MGEWADYWYDDETANPDCLLVKRGEQHGAHYLASPGGNKPGARCGGLTDHPAPTQPSKGDNRE